MESGWAATAARSAVLAGAAPGAARGSRGGRVEDGRPARARNAPGAGEACDPRNGALPDAGNETVDTSTSERTVAGAATAGAIGRRSRTATPARAVDRNRSVAVTAGPTVAGVDAVAAGASAGAGPAGASTGAGAGGASAGGRGGSPVVAAGGGVCVGGGVCAGGPLVGGTGVITMTVVSLVASCTCVAS